MKSKTTKSKKAITKQQHETISTFEFGQRVKKIREELLEINQSELAKEIGTIQEVISRLEHGIGGNITSVFKVINYLNSKGYYGGMIFKEPFDINNLLIPKGSIDKAVLKAKIEKALADLKESNEKVISGIQSQLANL
jgi:DNA-binding XRE family transcriptional regulator